MFECGKLSHKRFQCKNKNANDSSADYKSYSNSNRWCKNCKSKSHDPNYCRKKNSTKSINDQCIDNEAGSFVFKVSVDVNEVSNLNSLLVNCGTTTHILNDEAKFVNFNKDFNASSHVIELADPAI